MIRVMLGGAYEEQNKYVEASLAYKKAAITSDALGQFHVARQFVLGHGVMQDYKEAYAWISVAIAQELSTKENQQKAEELQTWFKELLQEQNQKSSALIEVQNLAQKYYQLYTAQPNDEE